MPKNIEAQAAFDALINQANTVVAVDFWASWCGPCQAFGPIFEEAANTLGEQAQFAKVNVDSLPEVARSFRITSIPSVLYFKDGVVVERATGIETTDTIVDRVQSLSPQTV